MVRSRTRSVQRDACWRGFSGESAWHGCCKHLHRMKREDVTDLIMLRKVKMGVRWADVAVKVGQSKEWTAAACLGQMQMTRKQAETVGKIFDLPEEAVMLLQTVPYKGSLPTAVPTDPLIYRWYESRTVSGPPNKELIRGEFGAAIMTPIAFSRDTAREPHEK